MMSDDYCLGVVCAVRSVGLSYTALLVTSPEARDQALQFATVDATVYGALVLREKRMFRTIILIDCRP